MSDWPVSRDLVYGCLLWQGRRDRDGYGRVGNRLAHVVAWERERGQVPEGKTLDHACRRRACVALHHLEPVTRSEQEYRKSWAVRARIEKCPAGHSLAINAIVTPEGGRVCRTCGQAAQQGAETP